MNLLLLEEAEVKGATASINGRRVRHIQSVLKKGPGAFLRAGVIGQGECVAEILALKDEHADLALGSLTPVPRPRVHVVVALPRPKALSRLVAGAASFGLRSLTLINAWKVEKSYFASPRLLPERLAEDVRLGCEQGAQIWVPKVRVCRRIGHFLHEEVLRLYPPGAQKLLLDPNAPATMDHALQGAEGASGEEVIVALGPEGGFVEREVQSFRDAGFVSARINTGPLKTEVALAATLGQLALLRPAFPVLGPPVDNRSASIRT